MMKNFIDATQTDKISSTTRYGLFGLKSCDGIINVSLFEIAFVTNNFNRLLAWKFGKVTWYIFDKRYILLISYHGFRFSHRQKIEIWRNGKDKSILNRKIGSPGFLISELVIALIGCFLRYIYRNEVHKSFIILTYICFLIPPVMF